MNSLNRFADPVYCIMRLIVGLMFACHGGQKLLGFPGGGHGGAEGLMLIGGIIELVGGLMIAFGFLTRLAAFISAGEMAVAYFMVHAAGKANGSISNRASERSRRLLFIQSATRRRLSCLLFTKSLA